jgi:hypothetical protein
MGAWNRCARRAAVALVAGLAQLWLPAAAHAAGRTQGLAGAERVLREAASPNDADAPQRRYATLLALAAAARRITTLDGARPLPDDSALVAGYSSAMQQLLREAAASGPPGCAGVDCPAQQLMRRALELARSPGFAQAVLQRFSTPEWQQTNMAMLFARTGGAPAQGAPAAAESLLPAAAPPPPAAAPSAAPEPAAGPLPPEFEFLAKMPTVERVLAEVAGADSVDTKVQQQATFHVLAMDVLLTMRGGAPQVPPQFTALDRAYRAEVTRLDRELRAEVAATALPKVLLQVMSYQGSAAFRHQTLRRFFDAALVAAYEQKRGEFTDWRARPQSRPAAAATAGTPASHPAGPAGAGAAATPVGSAGSPATTSAAAPAPPEQPRAIRSPSGVDMMVVGLAMGEPLKLPRCPSSALSGRAPTGEAFLPALQAALQADAQAEKMTCISGQPDGQFGNRGVTIRIGSGSCPFGMHCSANALLDQGTLVGVRLSTTGMVVDQQYRNDLVEKYGKPSTREKVSWFNNNGARWEAEELTWRLKGLVVTYNPLVGSVGIFGVLSPPELGVITVFTPRGAQLQEQERKRNDASRPRM